MKRERVRKNLHGRPHDRRHFVRVSFKKTIPSPCRLLAERMQTWAPPLLLGRYARRSELVEAVQAVGPIMASRTDVRSWRIGKPDPANPRHWLGLSVDHDLAPLSTISESRTERVIGSFLDWNFLHFHAVKPGRRKAKRGFLRCASQEREKQPDGSHRGLAAVRVWTDEVWRHYRLLPYLAEWMQKNGLGELRSVVNTTTVVPMGPVLGQLSAALWSPASTPRPPP